MITLRTQGLGFDVRLEIKWTAFRKQKYENCRVSSIQLEDIVNRFLPLAVLSHLKIEEPKNSMRSISFLVKTDFPIYGQFEDNL